MWIARSERGELVMSEKKPFRCTMYDRGIWMTHEGESFEIDKALFPELTWEGEPLEVEIIAKIDENPFSEQSLKDKVEQLQQVNKLLKSCNIEKSVLAQEYRKGYDDAIKAVERNTNDIKALEISSNLCTTCQVCKDVNECKREKMQGALVMAEWKDEQFKKLLNNVNPNAFASVEEMLNFVKNSI